MIYLDYSATTKPNNEVLDSFNKVSLNYFGNSNSLHKLGIEARSIEDEATKQIQAILNTNKEVIYTSGASESNNLALIGYAIRNRKKGNHIITTNLEHSSIYGPIGYLQKEGFKIDILKTDSNGLVDINDLINLITPETLLVSITAVNSETGIRENVEEIGKLLKEKKICFHVDGTQAIGKTNIDITNIDLFSFSGHKIYGIKGIGCLLKNKDILLEPLIHGGKSTTIYRSGTPSTGLIVSISKALRLIYNDLDNDLKYVFNLNNYLKNKLNEYNNIKINSNKYCVPHILNISYIGIKPETLQHALEEKEVYVSTGSACSGASPINKAVLEITKSDIQAKYSIRISLSKYTTKEEIDEFITSFDECYNKLKGMN